MRSVKLYTFSIGEDIKTGINVWVSILSCNYKERILSGSANNTNKNRAELYSIYAALKALKEPCIVHIYSDSQFVTNAISLKWISRWSKNGWQIHHKPVPNQDVWKALLPLLDRHTVFIEWVRKTDVEPIMQKCREKAGLMFLIKTNKCG